MSVASSAASWFDRRIVVGVKAVASSPGKAFWWSIKETLNKFWVLVLVFVSSITFATVMFMICEGQVWYDSLYWAVTTAATVGYGDFSPKTVTGKLIAVFLMHLWVVMTAIFTATLLKHLIIDANEWLDAEQKEVISRLRMIFTLTKIIIQNLILLGRMLAVYKVLLPEKKDQDKVEHFLSMMKAMPTFKEDGTVEHHSVHCDPTLPYAGKIVTHY